MMRLDPDGRVPLGGPCRLADGREGKVVRRSPLRESATLTMRDGRNHFETVWLYTATIALPNGMREKVRNIVVRKQEEREA